MPTPADGPSDPAAPTDQGLTGDSWVRIGAVVFAVGLVVVAVAIIPLFFGASDLPTALNVAAGVLPPLGFALAGYGLVRGAREVRRAREAGQAR